MKKPRANALGFFVREISTEHLQNGVLASTP